MQRVQAATRQRTRWLRALGPAVPALAGVLLAAADAHAAEGGLVLVPDLRVLVFLIGLFLVLVFPINALIFRPVFRVLESRAARLAETRQRADGIAQQADDILRRYQQSVQVARAESERDRLGRLEAARSQNAAQLAEAREAAEREIERGRAEVVAALTEARASLRSQAEDLARQAASRLLGRALS